MSTDSGKLVGIAFQAIRQCHQDVGKLIADLDGYMVGKESGYERLWNQDAVTFGVSRAAYAPYWMAKRLYRLYRHSEQRPSTVEGINIRFFADDGSLAEPRLVVGKVEYEVPPTKSVEDVAKSWDLDEGYHGWCNAAESDLGKPLACEGRDGRVKRMCAVARDLYSIQSLEDVKEMLDRARTGFEEGGRE